MIRILLFDDNRAQIDSLKLMIEEADDMQVVGAFSDATEIVSKIKRLQPDVIMMDIQMPEISGIEAVIILKQIFPNIQILMHTIHADDDKVFAAICAGASGYLLKGSDYERVINSIKEVFQGGSPMSPSIARKVLNSIQEKNPQHSPRFYPLTPREKDVLKCMVDGMSYKMIADACQIKYSTVNFYIKNIYDKLHVNSATEAVSKAILEKIIHP